jgi:hypothetical protein
MLEPLSLHPLGATNLQVPSLCVGNCRVFLELMILLLEVLSISKSARTTAANSRISWIEPFTNKERTSDACAQP